MAAPSDPASRSALALSGGGHRSCVFALGVLLYLADAHRTGRIASVASVSGGSLANGFLAQELSLARCAPGDVERAVGRVARCVAGRGVLFGAPIAWVYCAALLVLLAAAIGGPWLLPVARGWRILALVAGLLLVAGVAGLRGVVTGRAFASTLFSPRTRPTRLEEIHGDVDHVICATDLHAGEHVYFSRDVVCAYRFGIGTPSGLPLHAAVQASAAFPGVFPVRWLRTARFGFRGGRPEATGARWLALHDGGVYDNMADQWSRGLRERIARWSPHAPRFREADELIVVNGSAGLGYGGVCALGLPLVGELATLLRDKSVLYDNGNSVRRQELVARFELAERDGEGLRGALVHIPQSPFTVPRRFADDTSPRAKRARAAIARLLAGDEDPATAELRWRRIAAANAAVPTTLLGLGAETTARLLHHAYLLAMANLHVLLDYPLLDVPHAARFERLAGVRRRADPRRAGSQASAGSSSASRRRFG